MPFIETKAKSEYKIVDGKKTHVITPECEITLTNTKTGKEYMPRCCKQIAFGRCVNDPGWIDQYIKK